MKLTTFTMTLVAAFAVSGAAVGQTVLFDFEDGEQGWGSYGAITTDKGFTVDGSVGFGQFHSADFSIPDAGNFGIVDVSPPSQNLSTFGGISVDARFLDVTGFPPFVGDKLLDLIVATGDDSNEEEFFAPKQTMTDQYQTFAVQFADFKSANDAQPPTLAELASMRIKLVVLNVNGTGTAQLQYDQVTGLPVTDADFNDDNSVDGADLLIWQRFLGSGTTNSQGDANGSGSVDAADLQIWKSKFGITGSISAAPEPGTLCGLAIGAAIALLGRRNRPQS
jgi:hypothetical protein